MRLGKKGGFSFKAVTGSVSGAATIGGIFIIALGAVMNKPEIIPVGIGLTVFGVIAAIIMTLIIKLG